MLIYLDMCCLKRPFDDQSQPRVRLESEAVLGILALESPGLTFVSSSALLLENSCNPLKQRASRVELWLRARPVWTPGANNEAVGRRAHELVRLGFRSFDALHIACAEQAGADVFSSCDDRLLATAKRNRESLAVKVMGIVELAHEVVK